MSHSDDDNDVVVDAHGRRFSFSTKKLSTFNSDHPTITFTDNTTANLTEYPMNYADPNSPIDGLQELRSLTFELRK